MLDTTSYFITSIREPGTYARAILGFHFIIWRISWSLHLSALQMYAHFALLPAAFFNTYFDYHVDGILRHHCSIPSSGRSVL
jgi:hypothetical protein